MRLKARIGVLYIADEAVHAALVKTGGMPAINGYHRERILEPLPEMEPTEVVVQAVEKAAAPIAAQAESWVLCVDSSWSVARALTIPFRGRSRVKPAVPFELEPHLAFPLEEVAVDYVVTAERPRETDVLAIAVRRGILEEQLAICRAAGIAVEGITLDVIGLTALFDEKYQSSAEPQVVLHVFEQNAALVVLERRKITEFVMLPFGRGLLRDRPAETWRSLTNAVRSLETLEREPDEVLRVHVCGFSPDDTGGNERYELPGNVQLAFEGDLLPPLMPDAEGSRFQDMLAGCALAGAGGHIGLNFLDAELGAGERPPGLARRGLVAAALLGVFLLVALGFRYGEYRRNMARIDALGQEVHRVFAETFPDHPEAQTRPPGDIGGFKSFEAMQAAADEEAEARAAFSPEVFQRTPLIDLLLDLAVRMPDNAMTISDVKVSTGSRNEITVYGEADSAQTLNAFLRNLRESDMLMLDEGRLVRSSSGGRETFELVAQF